MSVFETASVTAGMGIPDNAANKLFTDCNEQNKRMEYACK